MNTLLFKDSPELILNINKPIYSQQTDTIRPLQYYSTTITGPTVSYSSGLNELIIDGEYSLPVVYTANKHLTFSFAPGKRLGFDEVLQNDIESVVLPTIPELSAYSEELSALQSSPNSEIVMIRSEVTYIDKNLVIVKLTTSHNLDGNIKCLVKVRLGFNSSSKSKEISYYITIPKGGNSAELAYHYGSDWVRNYTTAKVVSLIISDYDTQVYTVSPEFVGTQYNTVLIGIDPVSNQQVFATLDDT